MKNKLSLTIALLMGVMSFSLMASTANAQAGSSGEQIADSGMITLGPNEVLRITVTPKKREGSTPSVSEIVFIGTGYGSPVCSENGVCKRPGVWDYQGTCDLALNRAEACSFDIDSFHLGVLASGIQARVLCNRPNKVVVTGMIVDRINGNVRSTALLGVDRGL